MIVQRYMHVHNMYILYDNNYRTTLGYYRMAKRFGKEFNLALIKKQIAKLKPSPSTLLCMTSFHHFHSNPQTYS